MPEINTIQESIKGLLKEKDSYYNKDELQTVLDYVVNNIEAKISNGNYIYRGEPECYDSVSSNLYRQRYHKDNIHLFKDVPEEVDLSFIEDTLVALAKRYHTADNNNPLPRAEILDIIQHFGGETNLIDFTGRLEVALFFACFGSYNKDGRILLKKSTTKNVRHPQEPETRIKAQHSVFITEPKGIIEPDDTIVIPRQFKLVILKALNRLTPSVSVYTMYGDIWGHIKFNKKNRRVYFRFISAYSQARKWALSKSVDKAILEKSIDKYRKMSKKMPFIPEIYDGRGKVHELLEEVDCSIKFFKEALSWAPCNYGFLYSLGRAYLNKTGVVTPTSDRKYIYKSLDIFNKIINNKTDETDPYMLADCYLHRGKVHINLNKFKLAILDFDQVIFIMRSYNNKGTSDEFIYKLTECAACYHLGEALLCLDDKETIWSRNTLKILDRFKAAEKALNTARGFGPDVYKEIKGAIIGRQGFKEADIEVPDDIAKLLFRDENDRARL